MFALLDSNFTIKMGFMLQMLIHTIFMGFKYFLSVYNNIKKINKGEESQFYFCGGQNIQSFELYILSN